MSYFALAGAAIGAVGMIGAGQSQSAAARGAIATTEGQIKLQKANQHGENAKAGFANFMTSFNNNRQLKQFGKAQAAHNSNVANMKDQMTGNKLETALRQAESRGALAANMGFAGSTGASFDAIESSMRLRDARVNQNTKDNQNQLNYNAAQQSLGLIDNGLMGLDMSVNGGGVNGSLATPAVTGGTNYMAAIGNSDILKNLQKIGANWNSGSGVSGNSNLTGGGLGLKTGGSYGLNTPSSSTSFFNLGNTSSVNYSLY